MPDVVWGGLTDVVWGGMTIHPGGIELMGNLLAG